MICTSGEYSLLLLLVGFFAGLLVSAKLIFKPNTCDCQKKDESSN